jgi:hypothetical protein
LPGLLEAASGAELFHRDGHVSDAEGVVEPMVISFYAPVKTPQGESYLARANVSCPFFDKNIYGTGEDAVQAFFALPMLVVSYLVGQRREGYEAYWFEKGELDYKDFWVYRR